MPTPLVINNHGIDMNKNAKQLIQALNNADTQYLKSNTPKLAYTRANIRFELASISQSTKEKQLFLNQAVAILEQSLLTFDELPLSLHLQLSLLLAKCYFSLYEIDKQRHYLVICEQIIKPLSHHNYKSIYELLAQIHKQQNKPKLSQHWQNKAKIAKEFSIFDNIAINP